MSEIIDIAIHESGTGGDLNLKNNDIETIQGITNQVYLALFGGNIEQSTTLDLDNMTERKDWWGNAYLKTDNQFNSEFERTINNVALTSAGISTLEDAARSDLEYLQQYADITVTGSIIGVGRFLLDVELQQPDSDSIKIQFIWDGTKKELIQNIII